MMQSFEQKESPLKQNTRLQPSLEKRCVASWKRPGGNIAFELWHDFEDLGVHGPVGQIGNGAFKKGSHP